MRKSASAPRRVAIVYPGSVPWIARCLDGIRRYARERGGWHLYSSPPTLRGAEESALTIHAMRGWKGDAIIAATNDEAELRAARAMRIPVVNLAGGLAKSFGVPRVMVDHAEAGRLAAGHLLSRGLRSLAFFGWRGLWYSDQRLAGFRARAKEGGAACAVFVQTTRAESGRAWPARVAGVARWLASLPRPTGIFAVQDYRAQFLMEVCHEVGLRVPEDIAVLGMDNDETICEHCVPTLTSISRNSERVGWEAAALLDRLLQGEKAPGADLYLEPDGIVARESTDRLYCEEPVARRALDYMRENIGRPFNIEQLAEKVGVSKRTLETRFREGFRCAPHEFLTRLRVQHAQQLMKVHRKRPDELTARACGFGSAQTFRKAFLRVAGESPRAHRQRLERRGS